MQNGLIDSFRQNAKSWGSQLLTGVICNVPTACSLSWYTTYAFEAVEGKDHQRARIPTLPLFFESIFWRFSHES